MELVNYLLYAYHIYCLKRKYITIFISRLRSYMNIMYKEKEVNAKGQKSSTKSWVFLAWPNLI